MMEAFHREQLPLDGIMGLVQQSAGHWHLWVGKHRIPARLLVLEPTPYTLAIPCSSRGGDVLDKVAQPLAKRKHPQALTLPRPVEQGMKLRAQGRADWRRNPGKFLGELDECVAQAIAEARPGEQRSHALEGA